MKLEQLTIKDVIEALDNFDISHVPVLYDDAGEIAGLTVPSDRLILLSQRDLTTQRYQTIIHELLHVKDCLRYGRTTERSMQARTLRSYEDIFHNATGIHARR